LKSSDRKSPKEKKEKAWLLHKRATNARECQRKSEGAFWATGHFPGEGPLFRKEKTRATRPIFSTFGRGGEKRAKDFATGKARAKRTQFSRKNEKGGKVPLHRARTHQEGKRVRGKSMLKGKKIPTKCGEGEAPDFHHGNGEKIPVAEGIAACGLSRKPVGCAN